MRKIARRYIQLSADYRHTLSKTKMNKNVLAAEYAVRGRLVLEAEALNKKLRVSGHGLPFDDIIFCNIGNPQAVGQQPLTFPRQFISLCLNPQLLKKADKLDIPADVIHRVKEALDRTPGGFGAYSHSMGVEWIRDHVAAFIRERDQCFSDSDSIFLTNGASDGIARVMEMLMANENDGILIPIPQYPLYSATLALLGGRQVPYFLDEDKDWGFTEQGLVDALKNAKDSGVTPRAMVIINPGNPTGQVLTKQNIQQVIRFCHENKLVILADEVYQSNVYLPDKPFFSFKKVLSEMKDCWDVELFSFHSTSKGFLGECGFRGGYMEAVNICPEVKDQLYKLVSIGLCSNLAGQLMTEVLVNPPRPGEASYPLFRQEKEDILSSLRRRANKVTAALNQLEGVSCNNAEGAMYVFPNITIPPKAVAAAQEQKVAPDVFYCLSLLAETGICVVPGSGFGQKHGTYHFRSTFLPREDRIEALATRMANFHQDFMRKFR